MVNKYFTEQFSYAKKYLIPKLKDYLHGIILDVGCAEGGIVIALYEEGYSAFGMEVTDRGINNDQVIKDDLYMSNIGGIDFVILKDVIEHLKYKEIALCKISKMLNNGGYLYVEFPLKHSPYAEHQQVSTKIPYLSLTKESKKLKKLALSFKDFETLIKDMNFEIIYKKFYLFRPIYRIRYKLPVVEMKLFREFGTGCEVLLRKK